MTAIVTNKNASRNFTFIKSFEAGIMLKGWEVKSLREGRVDVKDSYVRLIKEEAWLIGLKIDPPSSLKNENLDPTRSKKLLLNKKEIFQLDDCVKKKGLTCVLKKMYWKNNLVKCDIVVGKGKKSYDRRQDIKERDWKRDQARTLKSSLKNK